ncbi:MAG: hypothetical protein ABI717_02355 [Actinomycetota bacterium]
MKPLRRWRLPVSSIDACEKRVRTAVPIAEQIYPDLFVEPPPER